MRQLFGVRFNFIPHTQCIHIDVSNFCTLLQKHTHTRTRTPIERHAYIGSTALGAALQEKREEWSGGGEEQDQGKMK